MSLERYAIRATGNCVSKFIQNTSFIGGVKRRGTAELETYQLPQECESSTLPRLPYCHPGAPSSAKNEDSQNLVV
jgi:hypothetical protein